jgi:hypothetical protein
MLGNLRFIFYRNAYSVMEVVVSMYKYKIYKHK